jgi:putative copper resistance protein D
MVNSASTDEACEDEGVTVASLPPLTVWSVLTHWSVPGLVVIPWSFAVWAYARGVRRVRGMGGTWSRGRSVAFATGAIGVLVALTSGIDAYADVLFSVHVVQHLLLTFVAPPLLALSAPVTLALRAMPRAGGRRLVRFLHSRPIALLTHPVVAWVAFVSVPFAVHFSSYYDLALHDTWVHASEHLLLFSTGLLYWWPIVGIDPAPRSLDHPARVLSLVMAMPAQSFLALAIYSSPRTLYPGYLLGLSRFGTSALADQGLAAALMWVVGGALLLFAVLVSVVRWKWDEERRERRREQRSALTIPRP